LSSSLRKEARRLLTLGGNQLVEYARDMPIFDGIKFRVFKFPVVTAGARLILVVLVSLLSR